MRDIFRMMGVLTSVCFAAAFALAQVHSITEGPIANQKRLDMIRAIKAVMPPFENKPDKDTISLVTGKSKEGQDVRTTFYLGKKKDLLKGIAFKVYSKEGFGGTIEIIVGVTPGGSITGVEILSMAETPGLGAKINAPQFKDQFKQKALKKVKWALKKDGGDIDQITGASISSTAVVNALKKGLELFGKNREKFKNI